MLKILQRKLPVELSPEQARQVQKNLQARFNSLLAGVRLEYLRRLGLDAEVLGAALESESSLAAGEVFLTEPGTVFYMKYEKDTGLLEAGAISKTSDEQFDEFFSQAHQCLQQVVSAAPAWQSADDDEVIPEGAHPADVEVSEKEQEAARELMSANSRRLLAQISDNESVPGNQLDLSQISNAHGLLSQFEELDLIRKDYAVIDQKTGQQILRVPSRASLEEASSKFFIGGTAITEDNVDEVISCTPFCRGLLMNDQWLLLILLGTFKSLGLNSENIQVCQGGDSPTRVFLSLNGQRFLVVLCNRRMTLDDSYLVSAQVAAYSLKDVVVVSTDRTSTLMRNHLRQTNPEVKFNFVDSLESLEDEVRSILLERQRDFIREILDPLTELTSVKIQELVVRKMVPGEHQAEPGAPAEEPEDFAAVADSMEMPPEDLPSFAPPETEEASAPEPARAAQTPMLEVPNTEEEEYPLPNTEPTLAVDSLPSPIAEPPATEDEPSLPEPEMDDLEAEMAEEAVPELAMPDLVPDLPTADELLPEIPSPAGRGADD